MRERDLARARAGRCPPPTSAATDAVWCGARNGRVTSRPRGRRPGGRVDRVTSSASSSVSGGRIVARRRASIVLPTPGGPVSRRWWPPGRGGLERATRPRRARAPRRGRAARRARRRRRRRERARRVGPRRLALQAARAARASVRAARTATSGHERGLGRVGCRDDDRVTPGARDRVDERERAGHRPDRAVEPELAEDARRRRARRPGSASVATSTPSATARSSPAPVLRTAPGARFTVMRCRRPLELRRQHGRAHPFARLAHGGVGQPDDVVRGQPRRDVDLDGDDLAVDAEQRRAGDRSEHDRPPSAGHREPAATLGWEGRSDRGLDGGSAYGAGVT